MSRRPASVLVMAKAPYPGRVKTRLIPLLGAGGAARLQAALIRHTTRTAARAADVWVAVDPPGATGEVATLAPEGARVFAQTGSDLGARMSAAALQVWTQTRGPVIVIGTDTPTLTAGDLTDAARLLRAGAEVVIGPALDGGYYLIGLSRPTPEVFSIDPGLWGGKLVFQATLDRVHRTGTAASILSPLRDLDTPADAVALTADPATPPAISALLGAAGRAA